MRNSGLILFVCAGLLLSGGAILGGSTAWSLLRLSYYFWTTDLSVELAATVAFVAGALLCLPVCWLATLVPYHPRSQPLYATLLSVAMTAMLVLVVGQCSLTGLTHALREPAALNASMHRAMSLHSVDPAMRSSFAAMQLELRCCGVQNHSDWFRHRRGLPASCCGRLNFKHEVPCEASQLPPLQPGCLRIAQLELRHYAYALSALSSAIIVILAVTVFTSAYTLASEVVERQKSTLRVAYLTPPQPASFVPYPPNLPLPAPATP